MEKNEYGYPFRTLSEEEIEEFKQHARENYIVGSEIDTLWHPIYRDECLKMVADSKEKQLKNRRKP